MQSYYAELDGLEDCRTAYYPPCHLYELVKWVKDDLAIIAGGHADIYNEDGDFVMDIEV